MPETSGEIMQCMEVWGGNEPVDASVGLSGLDAWVHCRPFHDAAGGGDVYYVSSCATGRIARLLVADVSGHGAAVAEIALALRTLMRKYVNYLDQRQFVRSLNKQFTALSDMSVFATALAITFFAPTQDLTLCNAGHPPPLIYLAKQKRWAYLTADSPGQANLPWGIEEVYSYDQFNVSLAPGDIVLCYTDSLTESRRGDGAMLEMSGLLQLLQSIDTAPAGTLIARLMSAMQSAGYQTADDVTLLVFSPRGVFRRPAGRQKLRAFGRAVAALARSVRPGAAPVPWPDFRIANIGGAIIPSLNRWGKKSRVKSRT